MFFKHPRALVFPKHRCRSPGSPAEPCTCLVISKRYACWMAVRLCSSKDLNFLFSMSLKVSNTTARSCRDRTGEKVMF